MAKKKKKKSTTEASPAFSNTPFSTLKKLTSSAPLETDEDTTSCSPPPTSPESSADPPSTSSDSDDDRVLEEMMRGANPVPRRQVPKKTGLPTVHLHTLTDDDLVMRHMDELVHGIAHFDIADSDEHIEAHIQGLDKRIVRRLKRGDYAVQDHLDLHGLNRTQARDKIAGFIERAYHLGHRCVLIIHGRGLGSQNRIPILKEKLQHWLTRGSMGKKVLAYTSAQPYDGGTGAVYVLLRSFKDHG